MHPADVAASMDAPNKFAQRANRGFADATCNLVTGVMLPLEPNGYSSCAEDARTVLFGNSSRRPHRIRHLRKVVKTISSVLFCWASAAFARLRRGQSYEYFMWARPARGCLDRNHRSGGAGMPARQ
jgi:hypothetical protein